jgi:hypothetical protein
VKLAQDFKGISRLLMLLLLIAFFLLGAILSYVWTMGFYAPSEYNLPSETSVTIENVQFTPEDATFFNVTLLNPSYSPSDAVIDRIKVSTDDGNVHSITSTSPTLPITLVPGKSQTIHSFWNWTRYVDQTVDVYVLIVGGSGPAIQAKTPFMNLTVTDIIFEPSVTSTRFNVTVQSMRSPVSVDISEITVNGVAVTDIAPTLPYRLNPNASRTFTLHHDWADLQNQTVSVLVQTIQGYEAFKIVTGPQVKLDISDIQFFNTTATAFYFNVTVQNSAVPPASVDINLVTVYVEGQNITIGTVTPNLPQALPSNSTLLLTCTWDWNQFKGKDAIFIVYTAQGFKSLTEKTIPNTP